jgi:predicted metal-dependent hydrolase
MPRFTRLTSQYVRRELLRLLRRKYLPLLARHIYRQRADASTWPALALPIEVEPLRAGIEALAAMPTARREPKGQLDEYERQLKAWKRRRTIARNKVAKYARLVTYHKKRGKCGVRPTPTDR